MKGCEAMLVPPIMQPKDLSAMPAAVWCFALGENIEQVHLTPASLSG